MRKPAARVGDMHTCPKVDPGPKPHVGGPVLPGGSPNVNIGGKPAARVGDKCLCLCPSPDEIKQGSATVFINGKAAARQGDSTSHGGTIVTGSGNVNIGDKAPPIRRGLPKAATVISRLFSFAEEAGERAEEEQEPVEPVCDIIEQIDRPPLTQKAAAEQAQLHEDLNAAVQRDLGGLTGERRADALGNLADYNQASDAADMARLSEAAYGGKSFGNCGETPCGFSRVAPGEFGLTDEMLNDPVSGFKSAIYETPGGDTVMAFAGTEDWTDWQTNFAQGVGRQTDQYTSAMELARRMSKFEDLNVRFTGHSLGGGLASAANAVTGLPTTTFNAAGLHPATIANGAFPVNAETLAARAGNVDAYFNTKDILSAVQDNRLPLVLGIGAGAAGLLPAVLGVPIALGLTGLLAKGALAQAVGNRIPLPSDNFLVSIKEHFMSNTTPLIDQQAAESLDRLSQDFGC